MIAFHTLEYITNGTLREFMNVFTRAVTVIVTISVSVEDHYNSRVEMATQVLLMRAFHFVIRELGSGKYFELL